MKQMLLILFSLMFVLPTFADTDSRSRFYTREFEFYYRFDRPEIDLTYKSNRQTSELLKDHLLNTARIDSVIAYVSSSPDGQYEYNILLGRRRASEAEKFLIELSAERPGLAIKTVVQDENWSGLIRLIEEDYFRHDRDKVLEILYRESVGKDARKALLEELDNGKTWGYILWKYMPQLRNATVITLKLKPAESLPQMEPIRLKSLAAPLRPIVNPALQPQEAQTPVQESQTPSLQPPTALWALRTNLLVPALNIGAEFPIGNSWSVSADYYFPWIWPNKTNRNCFELLGWSVEGRYWFGKDRQPQQRLRGHSVGLYAAGGYYDLEWNYSGQQGEFVSTGLDYTYAMAVGKRKRLNLEFTLAVGYIRSWGRSYNVPGAGGELYPEPGTVIFDYVGPTKAAVSLVVPFEEWPWTVLKARKAQQQSRKEGRR